MQNLPAQYLSPNQAPSPCDSAPDNVIPIAPRKRARVLVMDDEAPILELTARLLSARGYEVHTALDGDQAVLQYRNALNAGIRFDAVILDLTVPEKMGGYDAFKAMREMDPTVRAVVSSGYSHEPIVLNYKEYGLASIAPKPYRVGELLGAVEQALRKD